MNFKPQLVLLDVTDMLIGKSEHFILLPWNPAIVGPQSSLIKPSTALPWNSKETRRQVAQ